MGTTRLFRVFVGPSWPSEKASSIVTVRASRSTWHTFRATASPIRSPHKPINMIPIRNLLGQANELSVRQRQALRGLLPRHPTLEHLSGVVGNELGVDGEPEDGPEQAVGVLDLGYLLALGLEPLDEGDHVGPANPVEGKLPEERLDEVAEELLVLPASLRRERVISGGIKEPRKELRQAKSRALPLDGCHQPLLDQEPVVGVEAPSLGILDLDGKGVGVLLEPDRPCGGPSPSRGRHPPDLPRSRPRSAELADGSHLLLGMTDTQTDTNATRRVPDASRLAVRALTRGFPCAPGRIRTCDPLLRSCSGLDAVPTCGFASTQGSVGVQLSAHRDWYNLSSLR